jgi:hypothetical protein
MARAAFHPKRTSAFEADLHRRRATLMRTMIDRLDIIAVGVEQEGRIIAWMIGPLARRAIVAPTRREARVVKTIDRGA